MRAFLMTGMVLALAVSVSAKELQVYQGEFQKAEPIAVAGVKMNADGTMTLTTEWMSTGVGVAASSLNCWDAFGNDGGSAPSGGVACGLQSENSRWYFGPAYVNPFYAGNWQKGTDGQTGNATRVQFAWYINTADTFLYAIFTGNNQPGNCSWSVDYSGVIYDFGSLGAGGWYTDVDLTPYNLFHTLDGDGDGSYIGVLAQSFDGQTLYLSPYSQPLLWGANATSGGVPLVGTNHDIQLDDDNPTDGNLDSIDECYSYAFGVCPDPLQAMVGFGGCATPCDGRENVTKGKCKCPDKQKLVVKGTATAGQSVTVSGNNGLPTKQVTANANNKWKAVYKGNDVQCGTTYTITAKFECLLEITITVVCR